MQLQSNPDRAESLILKSKQAKRLNLLTDTKLYEMAIKFAQEDEFHLTKSKMNKLKGLIHTLAGVQACDANKRIAIIIEYLRHQTQKRTIREEEKAFYDNLIKVINAEDGLKKFFHVSEFSDSLPQETDGRREKKDKRDKRDFYIYYFAKEFLNHVIAEKMKGMQNAKQ